MALFKLAIDGKLRRLGCHLPCPYPLTAPSGPSFAEAVETIVVETNGLPALYFLNCSHPVEFEPALMQGDWINRVRGFRPNASKMEKIALGHLEEGNPVELGQLIGDVARRYLHINMS